MGNIVVRDFLARLRAPATANLGFIRPHVALRAATFSSYAAA